MVDFLTIPVTSRAQPIVRPGDGPVLLFNNDIANTIYLGDNLGVTANQLAVGQIQPLGQVGVDGSKRIYAVTAAGQTAQMLVFPSGTTYSPSPALVAAQIQGLGLATLTAQNTQIAQLSSAPGTTIATDVSNKGTPLLHGVNSLYTNQGLSIGPNSTNNYADVAVHKPGYILRLDITYPSTAPTVPFAQVVMAWRDPSNTIRTAQETWVLPVCASGGLIEIMGKGPTKGAVLSVQITNLDPAQTFNATLTLMETTHHIARDDWRQINYPVIPGQGIYVNANLAANILSSNTNASIPANTVLIFLMPIYAGQVWFNFVSTAAVAIEITTPAALPNAQGGGLIMYDNTSSTDNSITVTLPRTPVELTINNLSANPITYNFTGTILEYAS